LTGSSVGGLLREIASLKQRCSSQDNHIEELVAELEQREAENESVHRELNLERYKYDLLVDLVSCTSSRLDDLDFSYY